MSLQTRLTALVQAIGADVKVLQTNRPTSLMSGGVTGDGATDDTAAIQAIFNAGGLIFIPARTYRVSQVDIPSGTRVQAAPGAIFKALSGLNGSFCPVRLTGDNVELTGLEVDGNFAGSPLCTGQGNIMIMGQRCRVSNCYSHHAAVDGIYIDTPAHHATVSQNKVETSQRFGITALGTLAAPVTHGLILGNHIYSSGLSGVGAGLGIVGIANDFTFANNTTESTGGDGCAAYNAANKRIVVIGNTFQSPGNNGCHLGGTDIVCADNVFYNAAQTGVLFGNHDATTMFRFTISGNLVVAPVLHSGIDLQNCQRGSVSGNSVDSAKEQGINLTTCIGVIVSGNHIRGSQSSGIRVATSSQCTVNGNVVMTSSNHGITLNDSGCVDMSISGNMVTTSTNTGIITSTVVRVAVVGNVSRGNGTQITTSGTNSGNMIT